MEDVPELIRREVETYAEQKGFDLALVIDSHNSIGKHLSEDDSADMLKACRVALDELKMKSQFNFEFGFCHSSEIGASADDVGPAGMGVMAFKANQKLFVIGWTDGNNMTRSLRESIVEHLSSNGIPMLEVCTSDTHYTSGKARNFTGYYTFGSLSPSEVVGKWYLQMARKALEKMNVASYEVSHMSSDVKVMGSSQFSHYSGALDRSMNLTKAFLGVTITVYVTLLVLG
jgi:putative membrane protein